jgi:hypothetical protein
VRTVAIDSYLREALARGIRQVVILGAGLDGRAHRVRELTEADVFEVDPPNYSTPNPRPQGLSFLLRLWNEPRIGERPPSAMACAGGWAEELLRARWP